VQQSSTPEVGHSLLPLTRIKISRNLFHRPVLKELLFILKISLASTATNRLFRNIKPQINYRNEEMGAVATKASSVARSLKLRHVDLGY
jgi:hypothetical protein